MKRGFTLIEMLGILVVLSVIILISLPSIIQTNKNAKQSEIDDAEKTILMAAETYIEIDEQAAQKLKKNNYYYVKLSTLVSEGLLSNNMKNPHPDINMEKTVLEADYWVEARINNGNTIYKIVKNNPYEDEMREGDTVYAMLVEKGEVVADKFGVANRYVYEDGNPNNYVRFSNQTWRIVALEADKTIKIIRDDFLETLGENKSANQAAFGGSTVNSSTLINTYLNDYYYNGDLIPSAKNMIISKNYNVGTYNLNNINSSNINTVESATPFTTKIGLLSPSDYINASANNECAISTSHGSAIDKCSENNYLLMSERWWLMHAEANGGILVINPAMGSSVDSELDIACEEKGQSLSSAQKDNAGLNSYPSVCSAKVRPVVYLSENITIASGTGNSTNPYVFAAL